MVDSSLLNARAIIESGRAAPALVRTFFDKDTFTATHLLWDPATYRAAVIDSVLDFDPASGRTATRSADAVIACVAEEDLTVDWHLETHVHADHLSAAPYLKERLGGTIAIGKDIVTVQRTFGKVFNEDTRFAYDGSQFDHLFGNGDRFRIGSIEAIALHVPGHTPADMAYVIGDATFVGDTLFMPDYGTARTDFPGGSARQLYRSIRRLLSLPDETRLFLCHDYKAAGRDNFAWETTVAAERTGNIHVRDGTTEDTFVTMREARDAALGMPRLILPSIQVNMRAGRLPEPEGNGVHYLKLPINMF
ncbi:MBL fold metallo-hydrolase [Sphingosinicella microcystinivorans]|uniref:MBL fold metallo-hydrolase n=1 Tax=Sphingosinicella microcystinivorans TaxID=335406 RepID=UPI0022F3B435|nr:MBL fold metallo-hydrolase [Sphingosinicella microcystinivorans]WBX85423.1 MBL fold metallo-hydrolase [Sphingosinicella microcystinivorans]